MYILHYLSANERHLPTAPTIENLCDNNYYAQTSLTTRHTPILSIPLVTHRLRIEGRPGNYTRHLDYRERVPLTAANHRRVDVNV